MSSQALERGVFVKVIKLTKTVRSFGLFVREEHLASRRESIEGIIIGTNPTLNNVFYVSHVEDKKPVIGIYAADELEVIAEHDPLKTVELLIACKRAGADDLT